MDDFTVYMDGELELASNGCWKHKGVFFTNEKLSALFHRSIIWDEQENKYFVKIGKMRASFKLEDTAYFVFSLSEQAGKLLAKLSDESEEALDLDNLILKNKKLYSLVKKSHPALLLHAAYQVLINYLISDNEIKFNGKIYKIK